LEECQILLFLQEMDLEVREVILTEEQERSLQPPNGQDLSVELGKIRACVDKINGERAVKAGRLL
jgi:hypothetical protein